MKLLARPLRMPALSFKSSAKHFWRVPSLAAILFLSGGSLYYWQASSVRLTVDGRTRRIFTQQPTVGAFLDREKIVLNPEDFTTPSLDTPITHNTAVKITRVVTEEFVQVSSGPTIAVSTLRTRQNLRRVLVQRGYTDVTTERIRVVRHDGDEVARAVLEKNKKRIPHYYLMLQTKEGKPIKTYNLLEAKLLTMRATGYYVGEKWVPSDTTFLGHKLKRGLVAVDPKVIPLRTRLYVQGYGYAYASDTGSAIKKMRIDLAVKDKKEEVHYNRKNVPVYILEQAPTW